MEFIETKVFTKYIQVYLSDEEYAGLQHFFSKRHDVGKLVPSAGGVRKIRWTFHLMFLKRFWRRLKMTERNIGLEILEGIKEVKAFKKGNIKLKTTKLSEPSPPLKIRQKLKLSQMAFANLMGVSVRTLQDWEQGRRSPKGPAKSLLRVAEQNPEIFLSIT
jgi:putative transcriptional regulator